MQAKNNRRHSSNNRQLPSLARAVNYGMEPLEKRVLLAASLTNPLVHPLLNVSRLPKPVQSQLNSAGATMFDSLTGVGSRSGVAADIQATEYTPFSLSATAMRQKLAAAPMEFTRGAANPLVLAIPYPDGRFVRFNVVEAPVMEAGLAKKFPSIKTYRGQGIDDSSATIRLDMTQLGFHAQVLTPSGAFYIDPYWHLDQSAYVSYFKHDARNTQPWACYTDDDDVAPATQTAAKGTKAPTPGPDLFTTSGSQLRTYRLACAGDGEYTAFFGGTQANGQAAIVTAINRVTGVYEVELTIRLTLVANNINLVYTNAGTDPYSNTSNDINVNTNNCNNVIGFNNYDIGHVFTTGSGGVAFLGCVGGGSKGGGTTGLPSPTGDSFYIDYVAHEMGHQFGANHSFNSSTGNCGGGNRSASHAYEVGSGSTIMSYAGICGSDDLQPHSDPYMHFDSQQSIVNFVDFSIPGVGTRTNLTNNIPTVSAGSSFTIPTNTPFVMTATGFDADGDPLTYYWEERDLGVSTTVQANDNGSSPIFRDFSPTSSPSRTFRKLSDIINNVTAHNGEQLPSVARAAMNFRVTVRDNKSGGGGINTSDVAIAIVSTGAAFAVTSPNTGVTWNGNTQQTVTWNVAGTTANGINTANVKILMSTDGGNTYPTVLSASTANDGSEIITMPNINTTTARIRVEAVGNIFFDISDTNFSINQVVVGNGLWTGLGDGVNWSDPNNWGNNHLPTSIDDVVINVAANPTIIVSGSQFANTIDGQEALTINGTLSIATSATLNNVVTMNGGLLTGAGTVTIGTSGTLNVPLGGTTRIDNPMIINGLASVAAGGNKLLRLNGISTGANGKLDLFDNDMMVDYSGSSSLASIETMIRNARNGGNWLGANGITSSTAKNNGLQNTTLGAIEAAQYGATFDGEGNDGTAVLVKYTWYGDSDFNGKVDGTDYAHVDSTYNLEVSLHQNVGGWFNGDFDGNGKVDGADYALIDSVFNNQSGIL